jgi:hypothetical protein
MESQIPFVCQNQHFNKLKKLFFEMEKHHYLSFVAEDNHLVSTRDVPANQVKGCLFKAPSLIKIQLTI